MAANESNLLEQELERQIGACEAEKQTWERQRDEASEKIAALEGDALSFRAALQALQRRTGRLAMGQESPTLDHLRFRDKTLVGACELLARERQGRIRVRDAATILKEAGRIGPKIHAYSMLYGLLSRDKRFIKTGTGEFGLAQLAEKPGNTVAGHPQERVG